MDDLDAPVKQLQVCEHGDKTLAECRRWQSVKRNRELLLAAYNGTNPAMLDMISNGDVDREDIIAALIPEGGATVEHVNENGRQARRWTFATKQPVIDHVTRRFPVQHAGMIPWELAERAYATYARLFGRSQSLERLAERAGFGAAQLDCLLAGHDPVDHSRHTVAVQKAEREAWVDQMQPRLPFELRP
jgi:hypothetical protein